MRVKELASILKEEILSSQLKANEPILSAKELAEKHGTSVLTAHRAIKTLADEGLLYRVRGSGSFIADQEKTTKKLRIGVFEPNCFEENSKAISEYATNEYPAYWLQHPRFISSELKARGQTIVNIPENELLKGKNSQKLLNNLDGFITTNYNIRKEILQRMESADCCVVAINEAIKDMTFHQVAPDLRMGYKQALEHLQTTGIENIFLASIAQKYRERVFFNVAEELGFSLKKIEKIKSECRIGDLGRMAGQDIGNQLLKRKKPFAVFSVSDYLSFGIMDVMMENNLIPAKDFVLTSYDDFEGQGLLPFGRPMISSITNPKREIAKEAVNLLLGRIENSSTRTTCILKIPTDFIVRESSTGIITKRQAQA
jgi:DNA-binding LacI/PurR family transcriptional regulator